MEARTIGAMGAARSTNSGTAGWRNVLAAVLRTDARPSTTVLRVTVAAVMFPHGAQHALGWFGGYGFGGTLDWMVSLGFPAPLAALAIATELVAPVALLLGAGGRLAALGIAGIMSGAILTHLPSGFFMNWFGQLAPGAEGYEYHLLMLGAALALVLAGSGALSVDRILQGRTSGWWKLG